MLRIYTGALLRHKIEVQRAIRHFFMTFKLKTMKMTDLIRHFSVTFSGVGICRQPSWRVLLLIMTAAGKKMFGGSGNFCNDPAPCCCICGGQDTFYTRPHCSRSHTQSGRTRHPPVMVRKICGRSDKNGQNGRKSDCNKDSGQRKLDRCNCFQLLQQIENVGNSAKLYL